MSNGFASWEQVRARVGGLGIRDFFNLRMFGFALARAWIYLTFFHLVSGVVAGGADSGFVSLYSLSTVVLAAVLFAGAISPRAVRTCAARPLAVLVGPLFMAVGTLLLLFGSSGASLSFPLQMVIGVLTGLGSALINMSWGAAYGAARSCKVAFEAPFAFLLAAVLYAFLSMLGPLLCTVATSALPICSGIILFVLNGRTAAAHEIRRTRTIDVGRFAFKIIFSTAMFGLADGVIRTVFMGSNRISNDFLGIPQLLAALASVLIIGVIVLFEKKQDYGKIYKPVTLIMSFFFLLMPVMIESDFVIETLGLTGYGTFNVMIWIVLTETVHRYDVEPSVVFGFGWGAITLGVLLGTLAGSWVARYVALTPSMVSLIALIAVCVVLFAYMFVLTDRDIQSFTTEAPDVEVKHAPFLTLVEELSEEYGLSPKETEVLALVAKGRSMPRIQDELYISRGTATTHLRHIYQKMDIHDKQELLDLVEQRRRSS